MPPESTLLQMLPLYPVPLAFRSSIAPPTDASVSLGPAPRGIGRKIQGQDGFAVLLSCSALFIRTRDTARDSRSNNLVCPQRDRKQKNCETGHDQIGTVTGSTFD